MAEIRQRSVDREVVELAQNEARILLTKDKDFGWLAFVAKVESPGVVLIRFPASARGLLPSAIRKLISAYSAELKDAFLVVQPGSVRISRRLRAPALS